MVKNENYNACEPSSHFFTRSIALEQLPTCRVVLFFSLPLSLSRTLFLPLCRYNLKRKIAGLPPVTREWYEARRAQLSAAASGPLQRIWFDPLTKKKFYSENTYEAFTRSKKYQELVKKSGKPAPAAVVTVRRLHTPPPISTASAASAAAAAESTKNNDQQAPTGYTIKPAVYRPSATATPEHEGEEEKEEGSDWETASEEEMEGVDAKEQWEEWDVCRSLFDNHLSPSMEQNLEYMWRKFGFYLPDSEYLEDPEGLLKYLGAKLQYGHIPLYESGSNPTAKQMASLHGVQRHMVDVGKCKILYDGNEEEYEEYYNYEKSDGAGDGDVNMTVALVNVGEAAEAGGGYELAVPTARGGVKILGSREFARYYKQKHRGGDQRESAVAAAVVAQYRKLAVPLLGDGNEMVEEKKRVQRAQQRVERVKLRTALRRNVNDNLPKNVPY